MTTPNPAPACRNCGSLIRRATPADDYPPNVKWVHPYSIARDNRWCDTPAPHTVAEPEEAADE